MKMKIFLVIVLSTALFAEGDCTQWYKDMRVKYNIVGTKAGIVMDNEGEWQKLFGTGTAAVDFADEEERQDALDEAEMKAKASIAHFLKETITDDNSISTISKKMKDLQKTSKDSEHVDISKKTVKIKAQAISNNANSLLKGVLIFCRSVNGNKAEVVVGVSPKTQRAADSARKSMYNDSSKKKENVTVNGYNQKSTKKDYIDTSSSLDF